MQTSVSQLEIYLSLLCRAAFHLNAKPLHNCWLGRLGARGTSSVAKLLWKQMLIFNRPEFFHPLTGWESPPGNRLGKFLSHKGQRQAHFSVDLSVKLYWCRQEAPVFFIHFYWFILPIALQVTFCWKTIQCINLLNNNSNAARVLVGKNAILSRFRVNRWKITRIILTFLNTNCYTLVWRSPNWGVATPQPEKPCLCPFKGQGNGEGHHVIAIVAPVPGTKGFFLNLPVAALLLQKMQGALRLLCRAIHALGQLKNQPRLTSGCDCKTGSGSDSFFCSEQQHSHW